MIKLVSYLTVFLLVACGLFYLLGYRINATPSIATGLYRIVDSKANKGDYAWFCPPDNAMVKEAKKRGYITAGECPGKYTHFMKMVAAVTGDIVTINSTGVYVNNKLLPFSKPLKGDAYGRPLFINELVSYEVKRNEYLMMTDCLTNSFDARYFGLVDGDSVNKIVRILEW